MRTRSLWILGIAILSSVAFWVQSRLPAAVAGSPPEPTRVVFQLVRDADLTWGEAYHRAAVTLARRISHYQEQDPEIRGTPDEVSVTVPKNMKASEVVELATSQPNLRIRWPQGWGPPQLNLWSSCSITTDIDDNWSLTLFFDQPEARRLASSASGPNNVVGLFLNDQLVASQAIEPKFAQTFELEFQGLGRTESGTRSKDGSGYDPPMRLRSLQACLNVPLPVNVRIVKLREE